MTELSLGIKEGYDDNLFLVSEASNASMRKADSWFTTVSPKIGINFVPLLPNQTVFQAITFAYAPDFVIYHNEPGEPFNSHESYDAHRIANTIKGKVDKVSFNFDNAPANTELDALRALLRRSAGERVSVTVLRGSQAQTFQVTLPKEFVK